MECKNANLADFCNKEGISVLNKCQEAAEILEQKIVEYRHEPEIQALGKELASMRARITKLLLQAQEGVGSIEEAKEKLEKENIELDNFNKSLQELDMWVTTTNTKLETPQNLTSLNEQEITKLVEFYESYLTEFYKYEEIMKSLKLQTEINSKLNKNKVIEAGEIMRKTKMFVNTQIDELKRLQEISKLPKEPPEEDFSHSDRTLDSSSMPEEIVTPRLDKTAEVLNEPVKISYTTETQTGKSLASDSTTPSLHDASVICNLESKEMHDVGVTCAPPVDIEIQTLDKTSDIQDLLQSIEVKQTTSDGHETIEIASKPITKDCVSDDKSLMVDTYYRDTETNKDSQLNIIHSLPHSFEAIMVEPDETTTEVIVDADGTKRIIVKKVRKTLITRQQTLQSQEHMHQITSGDLAPELHSFSRITLKEDKGSTETRMEDGTTREVEYQAYGGQIMSGLPSGEVNIQEFTSAPNVSVKVSDSLEPTELISQALDAIHTGEQSDTRIKTSSSSVTAVVQQITKRVVTTRRRLLRKVVIIDGKEHVTEEIIEEPGDVEVFEEQIPKVSIHVKNDERLDIKEAVDEGEDGGDSSDSTVNKEENKRESFKILEPASSSTQSKKNTTKPKSPSSNVPSYIVEEPDEYLQPAERQLTADETSKFLQSEKEYAAIDFSQNTSQLENIKQNLDTVSIVKGDTKAKKKSKIPEADSKYRWSEKVKQEIYEELPVSLLPSTTKQGLESHTKSELPSGSVKISEISTVVLPEKEEHISRSVAEHMLDSNAEVAQRVQHDLENHIKYELTRTSPGSKIDPELEAVEECFDPSKTSNTSYETDKNAELILIAPHPPEYLVLQNPNQSTPSSNEQQLLEKEEKTEDNVENSRKQLLGKVDLEVLVEPKTELIAVENEKVQVEITDSSNSCVNIDGGAPQTNKQPQPVLSYIHPKQAESTCEVLDLKPEPKTDLGELDVVSKPSVSLPTLDVEEKTDADIDFSGYDENSTTKAKPENQQILIRDKRLLDASSIETSNTSQDIPIEKSFNVKEKDLIEPELNLNAQNVEVTMSISKNEFFKGQEIKPHIKTVSKLSGLATDNPTIVHKNIDVDLPLQTDLEQNLIKPFFDPSEAALQNVGELELEYFINKENEDTKLEFPESSKDEHLSDQDLSALDSLKQPKIHIPNYKNEDSSKFLEMEIQAYDKPEEHFQKPDNTHAPKQTIEVKMSVHKSDSTKADFDPSIAYNMKIERFPGPESKIVQKNVDVDLPSYAQVISSDLTMTKPESVPVEQRTLDKSIELTETDSSALSHYIDLPDGSPQDSPKPSENVLFTQEIESKSTTHESDELHHQGGYEPDESSLANDSIKRTKAKRKHKGKLSEDTNYPKSTTDETDDPSSSTAIETKTASKSKKKNKKLKNQDKEKITMEKGIITSTPELTPKSPDLMAEKTSSLPKDESYHTLSDESTLDTIKIVEECIQSSPENIQKDHVDSNIVYPTPVVEAVYIDERSIQTSPEDRVICKEPLELSNVNVAVPTPIEMSSQTSPLQQGEFCTQTLDTEDSKTHTLEETETQTSLNMYESYPSSENYTQVTARDIHLPDEKYSQTSSPLQTKEMSTASCIESETIETQTSPLMPEQTVTEEKPHIEVANKDTQLATTTTEVEVQTPITENQDQQTLTSPPETPTSIEVSMQTPEIKHLSAEVQANIETNQPLLPTDEKRPITFEFTQQTTPKESSSDTSESISTSEPYEIHIKTQISLPRSTGEFLDQERLMQLDLNSKKADYKRQPLKDNLEVISPESLSDPLNTEMSISLTPSSESELTTRDEISIDEGISPRGEPKETNSTTAIKLYSEVVRSKSLSPELTPQHLEEPDRRKLIKYINKRILHCKDIKTIPDMPITRALEESSVSNSYDLVIRQNLSNHKSAIANNDAKEIEKSVVLTVQTISIWLEEIQYSIITVESETDSKTRDRIMTENAQNLGKLQGYIEDLKKDADGDKSSKDIKDLITAVEGQVSAVKNLSHTLESGYINPESEWNHFIKDISTLHRKIEKSKLSFDETSVSDLSTQQKIDILDKLELDNINYSSELADLLDVYRNLITINVRECPAKLYTCEDDVKQLENSINMERDRLIQLSSLADEYEQTLKDFGQISEVAEALLDGKIIVADLDHLHEEIQKHRKFFINLSHCRAILESLEDNLDPETRSKFAELHKSLHERATIIIDRAASRAQQMTLAASRWTTLENGMKEEQQWLSVAEQRIPDLSNVTSMDHEQYINLYQSISLDLSHHYAKLLRLKSISESLQNLVVCHHLNTKCDDSLETLLKLQSDIDTRLSRLSAFKENWATYDQLIDRIEIWMKIANQEIHNIAADNSRVNLKRFWELKAQHEVYSNLKSECGKQFETALEILNVSDEMVQRQFIAKIQDKWADVSTKIDTIHKAAIQNITDQGLPSGEKLDIVEGEIKELKGLYDDLKGVIKSDEELNLYIERLQIMCKRIDRIQNELGRLGLLPTDEPERFGSLLSQSRNLDFQIQEELERSILLKDKILTIHSGITRCKKNQAKIQLILDECEASERLGSDVVEKALSSCETAHTELTTQWNDIMALRQALHTLPVSLRACMSPIQLERDISALQTTHDNLESSCNSLLGRLKPRLQLWKRFEQQLEQMHVAVREADYMVELLTIQGQVDYERLLKATEKLEVLNESLSTRGGALMSEVAAAAAPLQSSCAPDVAAQIHKDLEEATQAYNNTQQNLTHLCDKYQRAVELWARYREAAAALRAWADVREASLHALRPEDAARHAQACAEQEARLAELQVLAEKIAAETGSKALQADADTLGRRLATVCGTVRALADVGEARQRARERAAVADTALRHMKNDLASLDENSEIVEEQLIALRDNLLSLGKSELDMAPAKAELPEIDRNDTDQTPIVKILELWQEMFRDTFIHYHRLSTTLIRSGDASTALKLWHEYLLDLHSFLSGDIPEDYDNLNNHRHLCKVHRNLLTSQRSILMLENKDNKNEVLADKFNILTNLHNETLAKIVERHEEVSERILAWDDYKDIQADILRWLKEMEREKEKLQLRYVHIKKITKVLSRIQVLIDKVPTGRLQCEKLHECLKRILVFTDEAYGASVRMEYAGTVKRVDNLQASLETWNDFLTRIAALVREHETVIQELQSKYEEAQDNISTYTDKDRLSRPNLQVLLEEYMQLRNEMNKTEPQLEALTINQEQLKECLSPQDMKNVNQRIWQLKQQKSELEHQLSIVIHKIEERLVTYDIFESRLTRFLEWISTIEDKLETTRSGTENKSLYPEDLIRKITSEIQAETSLKEREFEWLVNTGTDLVELSRKDESSFSENMERKLLEAQNRWFNLMESGKARIAKINELLETIMQLEIRLTEARSRLHIIETKLVCPVLLEQLSMKTVDEKLSERNTIQKEIELESTEVGEILNLCELIFNDQEVVQANFDIRNLKTGAVILEKKWRILCETSNSRKTTLTTVKTVTEYVVKELPSMEKRLEKLEKRVEKIESRRQKGESDDKSILDSLTRDLDAIENEVKDVEQKYSQLTSAKGVELTKQAADQVVKMRNVSLKWNALKLRLRTAKNEAHAKFIEAHGRAVVALAQADVQLTRALHLSPSNQDPEITLSDLNNVEHEVRACEALVSTADRLYEAALASGSSRTALASMAQEYRALHADVLARLRAAASSTAPVDSAVQVETLKFEADSAAQVDTLTAADAYRSELDIAIKDSAQALDALTAAMDQDLPENASGEELASIAKSLAKAGAAPSQCLELAKHLSELLLTECDVPQQDARLPEVEAMAMKYEELLSKAKQRELHITNLRLPHSASYSLTCEHESGRVSCPLCSDRNWRQLDNDLWRLEQWLQYAEACDESRSAPPDQYELLEDAIQEHREFLLALDSHKSLVVSLNVVGEHVATHAGDAGAARQLRARLAACNARWDAACARAASTQRQLQHALLHNRQFHDAVVELVERLAVAERSVRNREPLRLNRSAEELSRDFARVSELRDELEASEPRVLALHEAARLLDHDGAPAHAHQICTRLSELRLRLQSLRKLCGVYALRLGAALARRPATPHSALAAAAAAALGAPAATQPLESDDEAISSKDLPLLGDTPDASGDSEEAEDDVSNLRRGLRFVCRVAKASLPFQALLLLLLGAAAITSTNPDSSCRHTPHLEPVLRFPDGPPPM